MTYPAASSTPVPGFLGRVLTTGSAPVATCFQVAPGLVVTSWHRLDALGAGDPGAPVRLDLLAGGGETAGRTVRVDALRDLAVIRIDRPFPLSVAGFAATDAVADSTVVLLTGSVRGDNPERSWEAGGTWAGGTTRDDRVALGRVRVSAVTDGMCGAPIRRRTDDLVVGVLPDRYNAADGWPPDMVCVTRVEDLLPLLYGLADPVVRGRADYGGTSATLIVDDARVRLLAPGVDVSGPHSGVSRSLAQRVNHLWQARAGWAVSRHADARDARPMTAPLATGLIGFALAEAFLPEPVRTQLAELLRQAQAAHAPVRLGVAAAPEFARLPWETLRVPGIDQPLALHELTRVYRQVETRPVARSAGPLQILVGISSPLSGGGAVLDYERELRNVLAAVRAARANLAQVRIVHFGTTAAIRAALEEAPVHVLHLSGHGGPGVVQLEDHDGDARLVTAAQFVAEAIPPGLMPPVIALAACHTDEPTATGGPSFAAELIARGAGVVIATETSISDVYATRVSARVYGNLAANRDPDVVAAVAEARTMVQRELSASADARDHRLAALDEWSVLTMLSGVGRVPLVDRSMPLAMSPANIPSAALLRRDVGEVVGRRREQRRWPVELLAPGVSGIVVHGIGGVGKTTLADELCARVVERDPDRVTVTVIGQTSGGQILDTITVTLRSCLATAEPRIGPDDAVWRGLARAADGELSWAERTAALQAQVFGAVPVLLVLDNFEDNLTEAAVGTPTVRDHALAGVLAQLIAAPGRCRLLVTSRYPFTLPGSTERALSFRPLGPLSFAETMKLAWALPGLDRLDEAELELVWRAVGGHPRCLEYMDALLGGAGRGRFPDVTLRLAAAVRRRLERDRWHVDVDAYFADHARLDAALAEVATLAADDVLLDELLDGLGVRPGAHRLLLGASVYRLPVDDIALSFQTESPDADPADPPWPEIADLVRACAEASLVTYDATEATTFVHRWTAASLAQRWIDSGRADELIHAHRCAADYWRARAEVGEQPAAAAIDDLREVHYHYTTIVRFDDSDGGADLAWIAGKLARGLSELGRRQEALTFSGQAVDIHRSLLAADPDRPVVILADALSNHSARLSDMGHHAEALTANEEAAGIYRHLSARDPDAFEPGLATALHNLGMSLSRLGRRDEALVLAEEAVGIYRRISQVDPGSVDAGLALALNSLGSSRSGLGRSAEALHATAEAVSIYRRLADGDSDMIQADLAMALQNLAVDLSSLGRWDEARSSAEESVAVYRRLVLRNPGAFEDALALALNGLGARMTDLGRWEEALHATEEAVAVRRRLVQDTPGAFEPGLASALNNVAVDLATLGRWEEALSATEEAVAILRGLVHINRDGFAPILANALGTLGNQLAALGRWEAALRATQESVTIRRDLVRASPGAFDAELASSLTNLAVRFSALGRWEEAVHTGEEAAGLFRRLAAVNVAAFAPVLAVVLNNLSSALTEVGRLKTALAAAAEAVDIYRSLIEVNPAAVESSLSGALNSLGNRLADAGRPEEALTVTTEAVTIQRRLVDAGPAIHEADLATVLMSLGSRFADLDRLAEAATATGEAVAIRRRLVLANPEGAEPELLDALTNLSVDLLRLDRPADALAAAEEAVTRYRRLIPTNPRAFEPGLGLTLRYLSIDLSKVGRPMEALAAAEEAVSIFRRLVPVNPELTHDLATALNSLRHRLVELGRDDEAAAMQGEADALTGR
jgi:tetratricopeptide (TPR) repeat protein